MCSPYWEVMFHAKTTVHKECKAADKGVHDLFHYNYLHRFFHVWF
ncbi:MAG: hypothetical protein RHS_1071 [Robinsoniella sp. RHS]|nr:MAG: hypothetical protein RHS_1071 [Robinsoniella sp. RHS]